MIASPLKGLKKPPGLKRLPTLGQTVKLPPIQDINTRPPQMPDTTDDVVARLTNVLGDRNLAKKLVNLKKKFPLATFPELVAMEFLDRRGIRYEFQKALLGGRAIRGGQIVDFALDRGTHSIIWEIQGTFWHTRPGRSQLDEAQKFGLLGLSVFGKPVKAVVALWESRLMTKYKRNTVLEAGLTGQELGR